MLVSDRSFWVYRMAGMLGVEPLTAANVQPASIDLTLGDEIIREDGEKVQIGSEPYNIWPGELLLATTAEEVYCGPMFAGRIEGKSSLGRRGLLVHVTAGFIDPGFKGKITLEMVNLSHSPISLTVGQKCCQVTFLHMDSVVDRPYGSRSLGSKYQNQTTVTGARDAAE